MDQSNNMSHQAGQVMGQAKVSLALVYVQYIHILKFLHNFLSYSDMTSGNNVIDDLGEGR